MKPQELRIGNWVLEALNERNEEFATAKVIATHLHNTTFLKPIPLTPEWLEKFGFEKWQEGYTKDAWSPGHPSQRFDIDWFQKEGVVMKSRYQGDSRDLTMKHIQYVHQLQNLYFALTGEEL